MTITPLEEITAPQPEACEYCKYYRPLIDDTARGHCCRRAPGPPLGAMMPPLWAIVAVHDWCGEFSAGTTPAPQRVLRRPPGTPRGEAP